MLFLIIHDVNILKPEYTIKMYVKVLYPVKSFQLIAFVCRAATAQLLEDGWEWTDQSAVAFTSWSPTYPQSSRDNNCVELRYEGDVGTGRWKNIDCTQVGKSRLAYDTTVRRISDRFYSNGNSFANSERASTWSSLPYRRRESQTPSADFRRSRRKVLGWSTRARVISSTTAERRAGTVRKT